MPQFLHIVGEAIYGLARKEKIRYLPDFQMDNSLGGKNAHAECLRITMPSHSCKL